MKLKVIVHEAEEGGYWAEVPSFPGCATQGDTPAEMFQNLHEAVNGCPSVDGSPAADGIEFVVEAADQFDRECAQLAGSEKFMSFLAERSKESGTVSLDEVEQRLGLEPQ